MSDFLLDMNPQARRVIKSLGLPLPMPEALRRARGPWEERPLDDERFVVGGVSKSELLTQVAHTLAAAGAEPWVMGDTAPFVEPGEAYGRRPRRVSGEEDEPINALVFDASGIRSPSELAALYAFFHPWVKRLVACGRVVVLGRPLEGARDLSCAAAQRALDGFVRSLARELGRRGSTAQLITVAEGAEDRLEPVLRWMLSARSAFVSGQPIHIDARLEPPADVPIMRPLEGKVALVTGAARGIGEATARLMAAEGAHVVCLDRPADDGPVSKVARAIDGSVLLADVSDVDAPAAIAKALQARGVDIVVHNAGVTRDKTLARMKQELWDQTLAINLDAVVRISEALVAGPLRDHGRIVCLSSVAGIAGNMGQTNYAASKAGVIGVVQYLAGALAPRGIAVNAVAPGFIETRLTAAIPVMIREVGRRLSNLGQGGQPVDVGELITFLASPGAFGVTGQVVRVCGGAFIGA
jgi:3-oxoacyl-[acyl-carrier protein] reductase